MYWNKFGQPDGMLTRIGDYRDVPSLWWNDPAKARALDEARRSGGSLEVGETDNRYWVEYAEREGTGTLETR